MRIAVIGFTLAGLVLASEVATAAPPPAGAKYVAMGSSYAAGTSLSRLADDSPKGCGQGTENYPRQVAKALNLALVDRSCGGATMQHVLLGGQHGLPAQIDAVDADTRLVTITIGGNDVRFTADMARYSCVSACPEPPEYHEDQAFAQLEKNLREFFTQVHVRAPQARIVFVDYFSMLPAKGTCTALAITDDEASIMRARAARLAAMSAKLAREAKADLMTTSRLSSEHGACSTEPWVWGYVPNYQPGKSDAIPFHPRPVGIAAVAHAIVQQLSK